MILKMLKTQKMPLKLIKLLVVNAQFINNPTSDMDSFQLKHIFSAVALPLSILNFYCHLHPLQIHELLSQFSTCSG